MGETNLVGNKVHGDKAYTVNFGFEYNLGSFTPMFAYQWANQDDGKKTHMFGLSAKVPVAGGDVLAGARYLFGKDEAITTGDDKVRAWNIGAAYIYPLSKRTAVKAYAGYAELFYTFDTPTGTVTEARLHIDNILAIGCTTIVSKDCGGIHNAVESYVRSSKCNAGSGHYSGSDKCFFHLSSTPIEVVNLQKVQIPSNNRSSNEKSLPKEADD